MSEKHLIRVDRLARVEGEGALEVKIRDGDVVEARFSVMEPPRFFEALLRGRQFSDAPDITARICGICPVAYQMSAVHAMESIFGVDIPDAIRSLRRLLYCGEWIQSYALHVYMLHAPDFLGKDSVFEISQDYPEIVERGLRLKAAGNSILKLLGGRAVHPINVCVGGFYRIPPDDAFSELLDEMRIALDDAVETVAWVSDFDYPEFDPGYEWVALQHPDEYPFCEGRLVSSAGLDVAVSEFQEVIEEEHVSHSTALYARLRDGGHYHVGPMARFATSGDRLREQARKCAREAGLLDAPGNPFQSILVRAIEIVQCCEEAVGVLEALERPTEPHAPVNVRAGIGHAVTEAPRGSLYHRYEVDDDGAIVSATIVPPTSQNQASIEDDLRKFVTTRLDLPRDVLRRQCEQAIRNYDPCISCSTHCLQMTIDDDGVIHRL
ncbi:MAG: Ni/Fe hydrogenase subunit alpha [Myxococcota bacterium]